MRGFYLLFGHVNEIDWPEELDLTSWNAPIFWELGHTVYAERIPSVAKNASIPFLEDTSPDQLDMGAYRVTSETTAKLAWRKPLNKSRGQWLDWHGNPTHKHKSKDGSTS